MIAELLRRAPGVRVTFHHDPITSQAGLVMPSWIRSGSHPWVEDWHFDGACSGTDVGAWYGDEEGAKPALNRRQLADLRAMCSGCPVVRTCLTQSLQTREEFGVWAGTSGRQRTKMRQAIDRGDASIGDVVEAWLTKLTPA